MMPSERHGPEQPPLGNSGDGQSSKRFRFKRTHNNSDGHERDRHRRWEHKKRHHDAHKHSKKRKKSPRPIDDPSGYDNSVSGLPPDTAFRESLFDAMADDEGAAFWEGVYGQPIHRYPNSYQDHRTGELEQMDDEEYAQFVRKKMWEKSWEGIEAAKEEKIQERKREKQKLQEDRSEHHHEIPQRQADYLFDLDIEKSLRRGEYRRDRKRWKGIWGDYLQKWEELQTTRGAWSREDHEPQRYLRNKIGWPVESGKREDVNPEEVERFFKRCADTLDGGDTAFTGILKSERVRWHPDKIQQRYGFLGIDDNTAQGVTAVFQILDRMWSNDRDKA